jgi:hypothetical protein
MNRFSSKLALVLCVGLAIGLAASSAQALPTYTVSYEDTQGLPNDTNTTLNLPKFNISGATLTNVWLKLEIRLSGAVVELDNDATVDQGGTAQVLSTVNTLGSSATLLKTDFTSFTGTNLGINQTANFPLAITTGDPLGVFNAQPGNGDYAKWDPGTLARTDSGDIAGSVWGGYEGTGNFTVTVNNSYLAGATFEGADGYFQGSTPSGEFYGKVTYTYTPEPATLSLLALGGLALIRRRR